MMYFKNRSFAKSKKGDMLNRQGSEVYYRVEGWDWFTGLVRVTVFNHITSEMYRAMFNHVDLPVVEQSKEKG